MNVISSDVIRGYNDLMILYALTRAPSYAYEISKQISILTEDKYCMKQTTLYSAFGRMEKNGYIESFTRESENDPQAGKRTYYRILDKGFAYYKEKCTEWKLTKDVIEHFISGGDE